MNESRYSPGVRRLHWLIFILVACALTLIYLHGWSPKGSAMRADLKWAHMQFGMSILLIMLPRLLVRTRSGSAPTIVPPAPRWQMMAAKTVHVALYVLLFATPLLGIATMVWSGKHWNFLGIPLPSVAVSDQHVSHQIQKIHETFGHVLMYLAGAHAAAALFHHFFQRDNTLKRMLPPVGAND